MGLSAADVKMEGSLKRGRYVHGFPDGTEAELTFSENGSGVIALTHTFTPPNHRGKGIAAILMERAIEDARRNGVRILPACSFARDQFDAHPEWKDLLAR